MNKINTALFLAPHTDDAEIGCGGTIARLLEENINIFVMVFSTVEEYLPEWAPAGTLKKEFIAAMKILGVPVNNIIILSYPTRCFSYHRQDILDELIICKNRISPDIVFVPSSTDIHQDHQVINNEAMRAFKDVSLWGYELPWNHINFSAQAFIVLKNHHLEAKWHALKQYQTQFELNRNYFSKDFFKSLARLRGTQIKENWAEAFEVIRMTIK